MQDRIKFSFTRSLTRLLPSTLIITTLIMTGCSQPEPKAEQVVGMVGGPCTYATANGQAIIRSLTSVQGGVEAKFDFVPTDANAGPTINPGMQRVILTTTTAGFATPASLAKYNIKVGSTFKATRQTIQSGTCTPVMFSFTDLPAGVFAQ